MSFWRKGLSPRCRGNMQSGHPGKNIRNDRKNQTQWRVRTAVKLRHQKAHWNMARIFISYSRESQGIVEELVQDLNDDGHENWFDQRLTGGQEWWDKILSEIR